MKQPVKSTALDTDLCYHWIDVADHRCTNYWREEVVLKESTRVRGSAMCGTYPAGVWRFCRMHAAIFHRDQVKP